MVSIEISRTRPYSSKIKIGPGDEANSVNGYHLDQPLTPNLGGVISLNPRPSDFDMEIGGPGLRWHVIITTTFNLH